MSGLNKRIIKTATVLLVAVSLCSCSEVQKPQVEWPTITPEMKSWTRWW